MYLLNVVAWIIFSSILQIWYVEVRISRSIAESHLELEIARVFNGYHSFDQTYLKTKSNFFPSDLHMKFDHNWPTGIRDILLWNSERWMTDDGTLDFYWLTLALGLEELIRNQYLTPICDSGPRPLLWLYWKRKRDYKLYVEMANVWVLYIFINPSNN